MKEKVNKKMALVRGLSSINAYNDKVEAQRKERERPRTNFFRIDDKQSVDIVFLQELDPDSENYSEKNDLGFLAVEHSNPHDFRRKALCSMEDEGACYGCEKHKSGYQDDEDYKGGWKTKTRLYINVLVNDGKEEPYVAVLQQSTSGQSITPTLIEYAGDDGTITDKWFSIKRNGEKTDTSYTLRGKKAHDLNVEDYELFDLEQVVRQIPYAMQEAHYMDGVTASAPKPAVEAESDPASNSVAW